MLGGEVGRRADSLLVVGLCDTDVILAMPHHEPIVVAMLPDHGEFSAEIGAVEGFETLLRELHEPLASAVLILRGDDMVYREGSCTLPLGIAEDMELGEGDAL